jgi:hypothetical protein
MAPGFGQASGLSAQNHGPSARLMSAFMDGYSEAAGELVHGSISMPVIAHTVH